MLGNRNIILNDNWTGPDKEKHFWYEAIGVYCAATILWLSVYFGLLSFSWPVALVAFLIGVAGAFAKEVRDYLGYGTCSLQDFVVSVLGAATGAGIYQLVNLIA